MIKPEEIKQYLQDHPEFFGEHPDLLEALRLPHPYENEKRVVSINERQTILLREKNALLQDKLQSLMEIGEKNDVISEKIHRLTVALLGFDSLAEMLHGLQYFLYEDFSIPHVVLRLWQVDASDAQLQPETPEFESVSENVQKLAQAMIHPYCGSQVEDEIRQWFGKDAEYLQSFAIIPLKQQRDMGLLVMSSPEVERFYPDMGTLYLERLGELISSSMTRLTRKPSMVASRESAS